MNNPMEAPALRDLLQQAAEAHEHLAGLPDPHPTRPDVVRVLDDIYRDLGRTLFQLSQGRDAPEREHTSDSSSRLFDPGELDEETHVPSGTFQPMELRNFSLNDASLLADRPGTAVHALRAARALPWVAPLRALLLSWSVPVQDGARQGELSANLQWACSHLTRLLEAVPPEARLVTLGLLVAQCRALAERVPDPMGLEVALDRLAAYVAAAGLPVPVALAGKPELESWEDDAEAWLALLNEEEG
jgi:hypothetical protein